VQPSVPIADGAPCTSDLDCGGGAFCSPGAGGANACHTSGLLQRGDIYYVAGPTLDLTVIPDAAQSQVVFKSAARCPAEPAPSLHGVDLTNVGTATVGTATAN